MPGRQPASARLTVVGHRSPLLGHLTRELWRVGCKPAGADLGWLLGRAPGLTSTRNGDRDRHQRHIAAHCLLRPISTAPQVKGRSQRVQQNKALKAWRPKMQDIVDASTRGRLDSWTSVQWADARRSRLSITLASHETIRLDCGHLGIWSPGP